MKKSSLLTGAIILTISGIICKGLGAFSKIPLANILTGEGIGIYQLIFPLYSLLLLISTSGIPIAISKIISENKNSAQQIIKYSLKLIIIISLILTGFVILFAQLIAKIQGNLNLKNAYIVIAPSIFFDIYLPSS
jgi:stage V sporulation protein B